MEYYSIETRNTYKLYETFEEALVGFVKKAKKCRWIKFEMRIETYKSYDCFMLFERTK